MRIREAVDATAATARRVKADHVRQVKGKRGRTDISTCIQAWRGDQIAAIIWSPPDRDRMLGLAHIAAIGFGADVLAVTMETYQALGDGQGGKPINPTTGEQWGPGEMQQAAEEHDAVARGWITEALMTQVLNRAGDTSMVCQPYRITGRVVEWDDFPLPGEGDPRAEGIVPDALARAMSAESIDVIAHRMFGHAATAGLSPERARAHQDVAVVKVIGEQYPDGDVLVLLTAEPGTVRQQVLRDRLPSSNVVRPPEDLN